MFYAVDTAVFAFQQDGCCCAMPAAPQQDLCFHHTFTIIIVLPSTECLGIYLFWLFRFVVSALDGETYNACFVL